MRNNLITLLLIFSFVMLSGCEQVKLPDWLNFSRLNSGAKVQPQSQPEKVAGTVLASVSGRVITLEDFNQHIETYNQDIEASPNISGDVKDNYLIKSKEDKIRLLNGMVEREMLIAEAIKQGIDKEKDLLDTIKALKEQLLFLRIIESEREKVGVATKEIENYYNQNKGAFTIPEERKVSMIKLPTEAKAKEVLIVLLQGADFAALARAHSVDESASNGGDIGFIVRKMPFPQPEKKTMFDKLEDIAFALELNTPSTVFQGPDGYYIIKVTEIKPAKERLLSEVYDDIEQGLLLQKQDQALQNLIDNLRKNSTIVVHEDLL